MVQTSSLTEKIWIQYKAVAMTVGNAYINSNYPVGHPYFIFNNRAFPAHFRLHQKSHKADK